MVERAPVVPAEPSDPLEDLAREAAARLAKLFGKGEISVLGDPGSYGDPGVIVPTGIESLDRALGIGGWPVNKIVQLAGAPSSAKTTLSKFLMATFQKAGFLTAFIDSEKSGIPEWDEKVGVQPGKALISRPDTMEEVFERMEGCITVFRELKTTGLVIWDSVAAAPLKAEIERGYSEHGQMAERAGFLARSLPKLMSQLEESSVGLLFINQIRDNVGATQWQPQTYNPGGHALEHWLHVKLDIRRTAWVTDKDKNRLGIESEIVVSKSKLAPPWSKANIRVVWATGEVKSIK